MKPLSAPLHRLIAVAAAALVATAVIAPAATAVYPGAIAGTVSLAPGTPSSSMTGLIVTAATGGGVPVTTSVDPVTGAYQLDNLPDGSYTVSFEANASAGGDALLRKEYFDDVYTPAGSTAVVVAGGLVTGVDAELSRTGHFTTLGTPKINVSTPVVGATLGVSTGAWGPAPDAFAIQWRRNGSAIAGATGTQYKVAAADLGKTITVTVTAVRDGFASAARTSAGVKILKAFTNKPAPKIRGTARVGARLEAVVYSWTPVGTEISYRWKRNGVPIYGAFKSAYKVTSSDRGKKISVTITVKRTGYATASRTSVSKSVPS